MEIFLFAVGWVGGFVVLTAFFLQSTQRIDGAGAPYYLMNFVGSSCILIEVVHKRAWPVAVLETIWALVSLFALVRFLKKKP